MLIPVEHDDSGGVKKHMAVRQLHVHMQTIDHVRACVVENHKTLKERAEFSLDRIRNKGWCLRGAVCSIGCVRHVNRIQ
jgi:hypothetical protein